MRGTVCFSAFIQMVMQGYGAKRCETKLVLLLLV